MKKRSLFKGVINTILLIALAVITIDGYGQESSKKELVTGNWMGKIEAGSMYLRIIFNISVNDQDSLKASLESPDQGAMIIPMGKVTLKDDSLTIEGPLVGGKYSGLIRGENDIDGVWEQMGQSFTLNLKRQETAFKYNRPQEPKPPFPYLSDEVTFKNEKAGITLAGTLTIPEGDGPFPAAIMITGSGAQNRDEELMGHKPFAVIADHLTRNGIAVLRYDDRGTGKSEGVYAKATTGDLTTDAEAAFIYLQKHNKIDRNRTGFIGHSEGGLIAPMAAANYSNTGWIVSLAGPGVSGEKILLKQSEDISRAMGNTEEDIATSLSINQKIYKTIKKTPDNEQGDIKLTKILTKELARIGVTQEIINERINNLRLTILGDSYNWFRYFLLAEPSDYWTKVKCPVLILNGGKDLQVDASSNTKAIAEALSNSGNNSFKVEVFPNLNHLFQNAETGLPGEYGIIEETISPEVLNVMASWIRGVTLN